MPHFWNNTDTLVVTIEELVPAFFKNRNTLGVAIIRAEKRGYGIRRVQEGGNGRVMLVDYDSLPTTIRENIHDPRKKDHLLEGYFEVAQETVDFFTDYILPETGQRIEDEIRDKYIANASLLKACQLLRQAREMERSNKGHSTRGVMTAVWQDAMSFIPILKSDKYELYPKLPESEVKFRVAFDKFEKLGNVSVISGKHGSQNATKHTERVKLLIGYMYASQPDKPSYAKISRQYDAFINGTAEIVNTETSEIYQPQEFPKLSRSAIYGYLTEYESRIGTLAARSGDRQRLIGQTIPHHSLRHPEFAGSIISIDDRQPPFEYAHKKRMWFYNAIDLGSEAFTAWVYGKTKEGIILDFYRQLVRNYAMWGLNMPAEIECESSLNSSFRETFLREGYMFQYVRIEANKARAKRIEAYYRPLRYNLEKRHEGWLARPFALDEANQAGPGETKIIPYDKLAQQCLSDIETWNNMPHSIQKDKTRWEVFMEKQNPALKPTNYKSFLKNLGYLEPGVRVKAGIMHFRNAEFLLGDNGEIYAGERLINLMKQVEGEKVDIYWLDDNNGEVLKALIYIGNTCICEALPKPIYSRATIEMTENDKKARTIMSSYSLTIEAYQRNQKNALEHVEVIDNTPITLNNKFSINGMNQRIGKPAEVLPETDFEDSLNIPERSFKSSLADRF